MIGEQDHKATSTFRMGYRKGMRDYRDGNFDLDRENINPTPKPQEMNVKCIYCGSANVERHNEQYVCNNLDCGRYFKPQDNALVEALKNMYFDTKMYIKNPSESNEKAIIKTIQQAEQALSKERSEK